MRRWIVRVAAGLLACTAIAAVYLSADEDRAGPPAARGADEMAALAQKVYDSNRQSFQIGRLGSVEDLYVWSVRCLNAEKVAKSDRVSQFAATKAHLERMKALAELVRALNQAGARGGEESSRLAAEYYLREAEQMLLTLNK